MGNPTRIGPPKGQSSGPLHIRGPRLDGLDAPRHEREAGQGSAGADRRVDKTWIKEPTVRAKKQRLPGGGQLASKFVRVGRCCRPSEVFMRSVFLTLCHISRPAFPGLSAGGVITIHFLA
jgi:hypothetical protein